MNDAVLNIIIKAVDQASKVATGVGGAFSTAGDKMYAAGKKANDIGGELSTKLTLPIVGAGVAAIKMGTDFNAGMANVATLIPGNIAHVNELKGSVQEMAIRTGKSTADLSGGLYQVLSAFGDTADSAKILEINAKSAAAGMAETTDAINLTSAVTKGYGDTSATAVQKASDLALLTVRLGQTTFPELAASIGSVTPLAAGLNVAQEELFGTMATFTGVTGGAAEVSTQLRGVLQSLMAPTDATSAVMKRLGYENGAAMIKAKGLQGTIAILTDEAKKTGKPLQDYISSIEGQTLAMAASGGQADTYKDKIKQMGDAAGTTDVAFGEATQGVNKAGFAMQQARAQVEVMAQKVGDLLAPYVERLANHVSNLAAKFQGLNPEQQKMIVMVAGIVAAIGPALMIVGKITQAFALMTKGIGGIVTATKLLASGVGMAAKAVVTSFTFMAAHPMILALTVAIIAIAGLVYLIIRNWDTLKGWFTGFWDFIKGIFSAAWTWIKDNWQLVLTLMLGPVGAFVALVITHWNTIKNAAVAVFNAIKAAVMFVIDGIIAYFNFWLAVVTGVFNAIKAAAEWVWNLITSIIRAYINTWVSIISGIIGVVSNVFNSAKNAVMNIWGSISGWFSGLIGGIGGVFGRVTGIITAPFRAAFNGIASLWNSSIGKLSFKAPDWVPGIGGKGFSMPTLPMLAEGGLVNKPTLAGIGEGGEAEAVIPLSRLERMLERNQDRALASTGNQTTNNTRHTTVNVYPQTAEAVREVFRQLDNDTILSNKGLTPTRGGAL
jgi:TP901 family phage tail tape measure protein